MADFLTTSGTAFHLENIIIEAKTKLVLVSPYLQISKTLFERLKDASAKGVGISIVYGKDELKPNEKNSLAELDHVDLYYFQNLHAKCYFNESKMLITSMNIYEFSEKTNREMGVLIDRQADKQLFGKAAEEVKSIIQSSEMIENKKTERKFATGPVEYSEQRNKKSNLIPTIGYCVRCEKRIPFNTSKPYCVDCYAVWSEYGNPLYEENVCHSCGQFELTTIEKPLCLDCYKKSSTW